MFGQNLKKRKRGLESTFFTIMPYNMLQNSIRCRFALTRRAPIRFLCSGGVVDEAEYKRCQRIIPKPPILSAPVTYQTMLRTQCIIHQPMYDT